LDQTKINSMLEQAEKLTTTVYDKTTIVAVKLTNGFVIVESASCVDPINYDEQLGFNICMERIAAKLYELEGYKEHNIDDSIKSDETYYNQDNGPQTNKPEYFG
jgi:hypothetical protein